MTAEELQEIKDRLARATTGPFRHSPARDVVEYDVMRVLNDLAAVIAEVERLREIVEAYLSLDKVEHPEWFKSKEAGPENHHPLRPGRTP